MLSPSESAIIIAVGYRIDVFVYGVRAGRLSTEGEGIAPRVAVFAVQRSYLLGVPAIQHVPYVLRVHGNVFKF